MIAEHKTFFTARRKEIAILVAEGLTSQEIGEKLGIAVKTVESHRRDILKKLGLRGTAQLTRYAIREGWVEA